MIYSQTLHLEVKYFSFLQIQAPSSIVCGILLSSSSVIWPACFPSSWKKCLISPWEQSWKRGFLEHKCIKDERMHECLRKILSQDSPHGEIAFSTSLCIYNVVYFATYVFITNKKKLVKLQYVVVYYGGMVYYDFIPP